MKSVPLHGLAPSPTLLKFLRAQVDPPQCAAFTACRRAPRGQSSRFLSTTSTHRLPHSYTPSVSTLTSTIAKCKYDSSPASQTRSLHSTPRHLRRTPKHETFALSPRPNAARTNLANLRRSFTSQGQNNLWNLWGLKKPKVAEKVPPRHHLPPLASFLDDNGARGKVSRPTNEMKLRCTEFDEAGNVLVMNGEFKKSELIAKYGLLPRDLRKVDSSLLPHILIRPSAILINLLHLRVLIKHNRVLMFDAYGTTDSYSESIFVYDLEGKLAQKESVANGVLAYEFRALEAVLISVTLALESEFEIVSEPVVRVLRELEEDIDRDKLRYLLIYSKKLGTFEQKARLVRDSLTELLEADDDLSAMYLTEKAEGKIREDDDHTEVEMLLESYHKVADEIVQAAENLVSSIRNTEEIVKAILDANRNSLMLLDLKFSIFTLGIGAGTFVAALYGMNLKNFIEESDIGFGAISAWCTVFGFGVCAYGLTKLRKVQRVSMWGEREHRSMLRQPKQRWRDWGDGRGGELPGWPQNPPLPIPGVRQRENLADIIRREKEAINRLNKVEKEVDDKLLKDIGRKPPA